MYFAIDTPISATIAIHACWPNWRARQRRLAGTASSSGTTSVPTGPSRLAIPGSAWQQWR